MKSKFVSASVLALAALASASSFALDGSLPGDSNYQRIDSSPVAVVEKTRAEVQAEVLQSPHAAYTGDSNYLRIDSTPAASGQTRADVRAELQSTHAAYAGDSNYQRIDNPSLAGG